MSFLLMRGIVRGVLAHPARLDKKTGELRPAYNQVQLECAEPLQDGQERLSIQTLSVDDLAPYAALKGSEALVEVGAFAKGAPLTFFAKRGSPPRPVSRAAAKRSDAPSGGGPVPGTPS